MTCERIRELLTLAAGGDVEENERIAVESHLSLCADCRRELEEYRGLRGLLSELREGVAPPGTFEKLWTGVRRETARRIAASAVREWLLRAAAVLVVGLAVGYVASAATGPGAPPNAEPAAAEFHDAGLGAPVREAGAAPPSSPKLRFEIRPRVGGGYYLPQVEAILETDATGF